MNETISPALAAPSTLVFVEPTKLLFEDNVRATDVLSAKTDRAFIESIETHGVLQPIVAVRGADGELRVRAGQRRTLAAVSVGLALVPVYVIDDTTDAADRIATQLVENEHRKDLGRGDVVQAWSQMAALGVSPTKIAKAVGVKPTEVKAGIAVAASTAAVEALGAYEMTIDQAAVLAEFDDDTEAVEELLQVLDHNPNGFDHKVSRLRMDREEKALKAAKAAELEAEGVTVIDQPAWDNKAWRPLTRIRGRRKGADLKPADHEKCPGHAAYIAVEYDWSTGSRKAGKVYAMYGCRDWVANGHKDRYDDPVDAARAAGAGAGTVQDDATAERRKVIANNKAMDAAMIVRREWLKTFLAGATPPKDAAAYLATALLRYGPRLADGMRKDLVAKLTGVPSLPHFAHSRNGGTEGPVDSPQVEAASEKRALMIALGQVLAAVEATIQRDTWRNPSLELRDWLLALREWGYGLSDVEGEWLQACEDLAVRLSDAAGDTDSDEGSETGAEAGDDVAATADVDEAEAGEDDDRG